MLVVVQVVVVSILMLNSCALSIFISEQSNKNQVSCNPQNRQLFGKFILMCWSNARKIIGLTDPFESSPTNHDEKLAFKLAVEKVVLKIFNHNNGASIYYKHWVPIPYIRIPNCGERSITNLLDTECTPPVLAKIDKYGRQKIIPTVQIAKSQSHIKLLIEAVSNKSSTAHAKPFKTFTIVADPLLRFSIGYQDSIIKLYFKASSQGDRILLNTTNVKNHLTLLLDYDQPVPWTMQNLCPMAGSFFEFNVDVMARQETLLKDWENILCPQYPVLCPPSSPLEILGPLDDEHGTLKALQSLLHDEPKYLVALCYFLLVDYVCLSMYTLPPPCQFLNTTLKRAREALQKGVEIPFTKI